MKGMKGSAYRLGTKDVARRVLIMRKNANLTSRELSKTLNKGHSFISNCELGKRKIDIMEFYFICEACGACFQDEMWILDELLSNKQSLGD